MSTSTPHQSTNQLSTVLYDGDCRFCVARIETIKEWDTDHTMEYIPRQDPSCEQRFPLLKSLPINDGIVFIDTQGRMSIAADAIYQIARLLPKTRDFAWLYQIPVLKQLAQIGYRIIAVNRKRLGQTCENSVCSMSKPQNK